MTELFACFARVKLPRTEVPNEPQLLPDMSPTFYIGTKQPRVLALAVLKHAMIASLFHVV